MTAVLGALTISVAGQYDIPADQYHADPVEGGSLSQSEARLLLRCPARYRWQRDHGRPPKKEWDIGHAAHKLVLGVGPELVLFPGTGKNPEAWQRDDDIAAVAALRAEGKVPLKPSDWHSVHAMADALRRDRLAAAVLRPDSGRAEQTLVWRDETTGVMCRAMLDWLRTGGDLVDYKTTADASPTALRRAVANLGYHIQRAHYTDGVRALGLADAPRFVFIAQEKEAPYLVTCFQLDEEYAALGAASIARAREIYRDCTESGIWPGYMTDEFATLTPPRWLAYQSEEYDGD